MLSVIMMNDLVHDARAEFVNLIGDDENKDNEILCADDTLIIDETGNHAETYMRCIMR